MFSVKLRLSLLPVIMLCRISFKHFSNLSLFGSASGQVFTCFSI